jgi:hypothetical protein
MSLYAKGLKGCLPFPFTQCNMLLIISTVVRLCGFLLNLFNTWRYLCDILTIVLDGHTCGGSQARGTYRRRLQYNIKMEFVEPGCEVCGLNSAGSPSSNDLL